MALALGVGLLAGAGAAHADPVVLKFASAVPMTSPTATVGLKPFFRAVERETGGAVTFQEFWGGSLLNNPARDLDALQNDIIEIADLVAASYPAVFPDASIFGLPGAVETAEEASFAGWKMHEAHLLRGTDTVETIAIFTNDPGGLHFAKPVHTLAEIKGLKIGVTSPSDAEIARAFGAAPVGHNVAETAEDLTRGLYDGSLNGWFMNRTFRISPVLKSHFDLALGVRQFVVAMTKRVFDGLPPAAQAAIVRNSGLALSVRMGRASDGEGAADRADAKKRGTIVTLTPAEMHQVKAIEQRIVDRWIADTPDGKRKYDFLERAVADYREHREAP